MMTAALTEVLNVWPILAKRIGVDDKIVILLMALVFGKIFGSLFHWIYFVDHIEMTFSGKDIQHMKERRRVILITDGDDYARKSLEIVAKEIGGRCLSMSHGNPSVLKGHEIMKLIKKTAHDPVLIMFDDSGFIGEGCWRTSFKIYCLPS